jgi:hypothetical protein
LLLTVGHNVALFFKDNMSWRCHKKFLLVDGRIRILEAQKHTDPEHCLFYILHHTKFLSEILKKCVLTKFGVVLTEL